MATHTNMCITSATEMALKLLSMIEYTFMLLVLWFVFIFYLVLDDIGNIGEVGKIENFIIRAHSIGIVNLKLKIMAFNRMDKLGIICFSKSRFGNIIFVHIFIYCSSTWFYIKTLVKKKSSTWVKSPKNIKITNKIKMQQH